MNTTEKPGWTLAFTQEDDGVKAWQVRDEVPTGLVAHDFSNSIVIEWAYADEGPPDSEVRRALYEFGSLLEGLDNPNGNSVLVHVIKGGGVCEWCYYAKDYDLFMHEFNEALAEHPRFPISVLHDDDPSWNYWRGIKECIDGDG